MTPIDWNKPVQTKDGRKVRLLCKDAKGRCPIVGLVLSEDGLSEDVISWPLTGDAWGPNHDYPLDLINVPEKHELWVNVYRDDDGDWRSGIEVSKEAADLRDGYNIYERIACIRVEFDEGEGLS